ncbi:MAG: Tic20 family protein [Limnospira sp.]
MNWRGTTTVRDRIFACLPYLLPLVYGLPFGKFLLVQFPVLGFLLLPVIFIQQIFAQIFFAGLIVFFALFMLVVRNENIPHFIRFNTMQAILLDIIVIGCSLILNIIPLEGFIEQTLYNMVFLGVLAAVIYAVVQSARGQYAEIPTLSDAVYMQVR